MTDEKDSLAPEPSKSRKGLVTALLALGVVAILGLTGGVIYKLVASNSDVVAFDRNEVRVLEPADLTTRITVNGNVEPGRSMTLFTHLTGPVEAVDVKVGDRVGEGQQVARIDVSNLEQDLNQKLAQDAQSLATSMAAIEDAERARQQLQTQIDQGLNEQLNGAQAALKAADDAYIQAEQDFDYVKNRTQAGRNEKLLAQDNAIKQSRNGLIGAALGVARAGVGTAATAEGVFGGAAGVSPTAPIGDTLSNIEAMNTFDTALDNLHEAQAAYEDTLGEVSKDLVDAQRQVAKAFDAKAQAATSLAAAQLAVNQQLQTAQDAVARAERDAKISRTATGNGTDQLRMDIAQAGVNAPFNGVVTAVTAEQGKPAAGQLVTIADDSTMVIKTTVKENQVEKIKPGQEVIFTTPATGSKEFTGQIKSVSPVAANPMPTGEGAAAAAANTGDAKKANFPIEITVTGNREGLRLGASAKARIITHKVPQVLSVPKDAIIDGEHGKQVFVINNDDVIEARDVETGEGTDYEIAITTGLKKGDRVILQGDSGRDKVGKTATINTPEDEAPSTEEKQS